MNTISVIVPVYNVAPYLDKAVSSVCDQTYTDWEMVLVDDGSTDASPAMCDAWAKKDSRIRIIHKENGGVSTARNAGLDAAQGDYVFFLDADDYIHPETLQILLALADEHHADIACGFTRGTDRRDYEEPEMSDYTVQTANGKQTVQYWMNTADAMRFFGYSSSGVWAKLFKRKIFETIRFDTRAQVAEDTEILPYLFDAADTVVTIDRRLYYLYHRPGSLSRQPATKERTENFCESLCRMYLRRLAYFRAKRQDGYEALLRDTYRIAANDLIEQREKVKQYPYCRKLLQKSTRTVLRDMRRDGVVPPVQRWKFTVFYRFPILYSIVYKRSF